jgi:hypothetical protein
LKPYYWTAKELSSNRVFLYAKNKSSPTQGEENGMDYLSVFR